MATALLLSYNFSPNNVSAATMYLWSLAVRAILAYQFTILKWTDYVLCSFAKDQLPLSEVPYISSQVYQATQCKFGKIIRFKPCG